jgi:FkbM family methyltransferase
MGRRRASSSHVAEGDRDARDEFLAQARELAPYLGVEADGSRFVVATWDRHMGKHLFIKQGRPEFRVLSRAVRVIDALFGDDAVADRVFVDVGANIGTSTISALASQGFGSAVCCEPEEENYRLLRANLALNDLEERTSTLRVAVSDRPGTSNLVVVGGPAGKSRIVSDPEKLLDKRVERAARRLEDPSVELPEMTVTEVEVVTLDGLVSDSVIDVDRLGMLWIDAEGHEGHILRGGHSLTEHGVPLVFEFHPSGLEAHGTRAATHEIAEERYTHFVDMRRQEPDHERFGLQPVSELRAFAERFLDPASTASYTDILLLRLSAAQAKRGENLPELIARRRERAGDNLAGAAPVRRRAPRRTGRESRLERKPAHDLPPASPDPVIAFVHIQRTAGATVRAMLDRAVSSSAVRDAGDYFRSRDEVAAKLAGLPKRGWEKWRRRGGRIVVGHVPYGLYHGYLPSDTRYVTFLRDPVDRVISHYHGLVRRRNGSDDQQGPTADSLEEALTEMRLPQLNDLATRYLCGDSSPREELSPSALEDAKENLRKFAFVGLRERFDESVVLLHRTLGLRIEPYLNRHVSLDRPRVEEIPDEQRAMIAEHNRLDAELYSFGQELLDETVVSAGDSFAAEVEAVRSASAAANEEAIQKALEWLDAELPAGSSKPKHELLARAKLGGIPIPALKHSLNLLSATRELDGTQRIWSRPDESSG